MNYEKLPTADLMKIGIMKNPTEFSDVLNEKQVSDFLKGGTMLVENQDNKYIFNLKTEIDETVTLNKAIVNPSFEMSNKLDNSENKETLKSEVYNKQIKGFGEIKEVTQKPFLDNPENETKTYVKLQAENGREYEFWGEENLKNKMGDFKVGDNVQIDFKGIEADSVKQGDNIYIKNENIFAVNKLENPKDGIDENILFAYNPQTNQVVSFSPKLNNLISLNGFELSEDEKEQLQKGGEISLPDGSNVRIDPNADGGLQNLSERQRKLLMASFLLDGGMTAMTIIITRAIMNREEKKKNIELQKNSKLYKTSLDKMLKYLATKRTQYPNDAKIKNDMNIVSKEISKVSATPDISEARKNSGNDDLANKGQVNNIHVNDYDVYEDINREREKEQQIKRDENWNRDLNGNSIPDRLEKDQEKTQGGGMKR